MAWFQRRILRSRPLLDSTIRLSWEPSQPVSPGGPFTMSEPLHSASEPEWAAFAAIDWADQKHFCRLLVAGSQESEQAELENTPETIEVWAAALEQSSGGRPIA